jgi:hypothetical protein
LTSKLAFAVAVCPSASATINDTVDDPVCPAAGVRAAVQDDVSMPHPELIKIPELGNTVVLLLLAVTVSEPDPERANAIADGEFGRVTD